MTNKKILVLISFMLLSLISFVGCSFGTSDQDKIKIEVKGDTEITLYTEPENDSQEKATLITISVTGVDKEVQKGVTYTIENEDVLGIEIKSGPDEYGNSEVLLTAKHGGSTLVKFMSVYGDKNVTVLVNVVERLTKMSVSPNYSNTVFTNSVNALEPMSIVSFEPSTTSQKNVKFELYSEYENIEIAERDGVQVLNVGECGTQVIKIKATAMDGNQAIKNIPSVFFEVKVIEKLTEETVTVKNVSRGDEVISCVNGVYDTIELTSNSPINSPKRINNINIVVEPKNNTEAKFLIEEKNYGSLDREIAETTRIGDEDSFGYEIRGIGSGQTSVYYVITIEGFEGYQYEINIPVNVVELPSVVSVNGNNTDFTGKLYTVYNTYGMEFDVIVGSSNAYDHRYEVRVDPSVVTLYDTLGHVIPLIDIDGETIRKTNPMDAEAVSTIYAVANVEAANKNVSSTISFIAYVTANSTDSIVQTNFNFTVSQGVKEIQIEEYANNTIYIEKDGKAYLNYVLEPSSDSESGESIVYDESQISYKILTSGGENYISLEKTGEQGQFVVNGLNNVDKVSVCVVSANGVVSNPVNVSVYTPGSFVVVKLPSASTNNNILVTNYSDVRYGYEGVYSIKSLSEPFNYIEYDDGVPTVTLQDGEDIEAPVFAAVVATNTTTKFELENDPLNEEQTIISKSFKFVVPETTVGNVVKFRGLTAKDTVKAQITSGGYLQTLQEGTIYVLIETKFLTGGEGNGTVQTKSYFRLVAINSYPKISSVTLRSLSEDVVYNKQGLGEIDIMNTEFKTYNFTRLTIGPETALNKEILRKETTDLRWEITGVPEGIEIRYVVASDFYEFNRDKEAKISDFNGITIVYDDSQGAYGYSDSEEKIYTRAYVFFNFDDNYFGTRNSIVFTLSTHLTQFNSNYVKSVLVTVKRPVVAQSIDLNYAAINVSNDYKRLMTQVNPYSYELYIDSRDGLNEYNGIKNLTARNRNLTNSFAITVTLHPSNITNSKLRYILCDADGNEVNESGIIKVLDDGTIIPVSPGVQYVKLVPMSGELVNNVIIIVRVADGESWETAYKIYNQTDLLNIEGTSETREYLNKYYELANDIYMNTTITPLGVFDDEVYSFAGGLSGFDVSTGKTYKIYNLELASKTTEKESGKQTYLGLFGSVTGIIKDIKIEVASVNINLIEAGGNYIGIVAGKSSVESVFGGINVEIKEFNVNTTEKAYIGGLIGLNEGTINDVSEDIVSNGAIIRTRVTGNMSVYVQTSAVTYIGGFAGINTGSIISDFNYFGNNINYNNSDDNSGIKIIVNSIATTRAGNVGSIVGTNTGVIKNVSSVANIVANIENAGGIVGTNNGKMVECYFAGEVRGADNVGGIAGKVDVNETSVSCSEAMMSMCITEILDTTVNTATMISQSRIQGNKNVGGLVGYVDFTVPSSNHIYQTGYHTIEYSYVRSYLMSFGYSDILLIGSTGNIGGLVGYAKNVNISKSYASVNITIEKMTEGLNVGGLVGKLENNMFTARKESGAFSFADNTKVRDCFASGTILIKDAEENENLYVGQLIGLIDLKLTPSQQSSLVERVYTNVKTKAVYNSLFRLGLVGSVVNTTNTLGNLFSESYYLYNEDAQTPYNIGTPKTTLELTDTRNTFINWSTLNSTWKVLNGLNDEMMVIYKDVDGQLLPLYTIIPTNIDLNIKDYTVEDGDQLFTRIDSLSTDVNSNERDQISKSAVLYIYEGETNEYNIKDVINVITNPSRLTNERYYVISNNENIVKVVGDKLYPTGEGTAIITVCSAYSKESVYDCIQLAVVYHNFEMRFLDGDLNQYSDDDIIRISKSGSEQIIVYTDENSAVNGVKVVGDIKTDNENAITVNEKVLGTNILFNTNSGAVYSNLLSIKENSYYNETTYIVLETIPYFNVGLYTNPKSPTQETYGQKTIYNIDDSKNINLTIYVGATEISFNTNDVKAGIGSEISVTVTLKTDYQDDTLLMFVDDELYISDNSYDTNIQIGEFQISYFANNRNIATYFDTFQNKEVFSGYITYDFTINASNDYIGTYDSNNLKVLYETIRGSLTFAGKSSYLDERVSTNIEDYPVKNVFNFRITPAIVSSINIQNYSAGRTVSGKYDPSEDPSTAIVPGEIGLLDILVTPVYAGITKITLENETTNYTKISLLQVLQEEETGLYIQTNSLIKNTENGIELNLVSSIDSEGNIKYDGHIYVRTLIASEIPYDIDLTMIVTAVFEEDGKVSFKVQTITLKTAEAAGLKMDYDGVKYAYIVKGTSITPRTRILGFTNKAVYKIASIEPTYENFVHYFDPSFVSTLEKNSVTEDIIETLLNDQIKVNSETGEVYVGVLIRKGIVLTLEGSVTEYMNNGIKIGSDSLNLYVVDYQITGIKVQNAVNDTVMAVCNIPKTLKVDITVERCTFEEYNYRYKELEDILPVSIYKNVEKAAKTFFGVETDYKSNIDVEIENLLHSINTYDEGIWLYTADALGSTNKRYNSIVIGEYYNDLFEVQRVEYSLNSSDYCYAVRLKEEALLSFKAKVNLTFNFDSLTGEVKYTFNPLFDEEIAGDNMMFEVDFNIKGINSTSVDNPLPIYDKDKFIDYLFGTQDTHYILLTDITLDNWTAKDISVASFDGNGYTITINSFADARDDISFVGLFKSISANTLLTNVKVMYKGNVDIRNTMGLVNEINVGLFAYENNGTLFNCSVIVDGETNIEVITDAQKVNNGLFVTKNNTSGSISNCQVGSIDGIQDLNSVLHYASNGEIGGFVDVNDGHIASSFAKNISIKRKDAVETEETDSGVAGFVVKNTSRGEIYFSYVEGIRGDNTKDTQIQLSDEGYKNYNTGIYSPGRVAGFAYINNGYIQDAYANIPLISPTSSTGFVYSNGAGATVMNAYSACLQPTKLDESEEFSNTSHSQFTGINDFNEVLNDGEIVYAYYYNALYDENIYAQLGEPALAIPADSFKNSTEEFGNFISGENMIWEAGTLAPQLVSANRIIRRQRFLLNNLTGNESEETLEQYIYYYEDKVDGEFDYYGSYTNPIIIENGMDFVHMSDEDKLTPYTNSTTGETYITSLNQNNYIVIKDVDLSTVIDSGLENLQSITYAGMLEGNGYTFDNVSIVSEKSARLSGVSFGMFEQIGALVLFDKDLLVTVDSTSYCCQIKNLTINIETISGTHATAVGTLAGVIVNADIININIEAIKASGNVTVQGERYVGAIAGYVAGSSRFININSNISVSAEFRNEGTDINKINPYFMDNISLSNSIGAYKFNIDTQSFTGGFAGGLVGLVDCFTLKIVKSGNTVYASISRNDYDKIGYNYIAVNFPPQINSVKVSGEISIIGDVVGGIIGLNNSGTSVYNARFELEKGNTQKISGEIIAGGLIGMNYGKIDQSAIAHRQDIQDDIDAGIIFKNELNKELFYESNKYPVYVGGLVGYDYGFGLSSGIVTNCYSRADVINLNADYVGGMVGYLASGYLQYCYTSANVVSNQQRVDSATGNMIGENKMAGGAVGYLASFVSKNSVKYFTEYTGLSYYTMWGLVCANDWDDDTINKSTTAALIGYVSSNIKLEENVINSAMEIFYNNLDETLFDVMYYATTDKSYNITINTESLKRAITSYSYDAFKSYHKEDSVTDAQTLYETWDKTIWDVQTPYFPILLLHRNAEQNYITNEEELRSIGTDGFYILENDIYLTEDWIPIDGFEGTLTSKKKNDGTYCTIYNININGKCYDDGDEDTPDTIGNVGFFSSVKDKAYIYNINFVIGGNICLPENDNSTDSTVIHEQRKEWKNYEGKIGYTADSDRVGDISYEEAFINGIRNHVDFSQIIKNNAKDMQNGFFINSYGTGALAGVITNATVSNVVVSYGQYTEYSKDGHTAYARRATISTNTPYIGGFVGYAQNTKFTNCQVSENPITTYIKNEYNNQKMYVEGDATIDVYNNEYIESITSETVKSVVKDYDGDLDKIAKIILEFYQQPQCVGGFAGKLDADSIYTRFNSGYVKSHINIYEKYTSGKAYRLPSMSLYVGGLIGHANVAAIEGVNVNSTIISSVNNIGIDISRTGLDASENKTELCIGGVIGVSDKSVYTTCVFKGTIKLINSKKQSKSSGAVAQSMVNIGGIIGKTRGDVTTYYCVATSNKFTQMSGYADYVDPIIVDIDDKLDYMYIGGVVGNAMTSSVKIKKSLFSGNINLLNGKINNLFVGGILGNLNSSNSLSNQATIQSSYSIGTIDVQTKVYSQIIIGGLIGLAQRVNLIGDASTMNIINLGSSLDKNAIVYAGNLAGMLGYKSGANATVTDCFTSGAIRIDKANLNGAIGGFVGAMFGNVKTSYTATTITSVSDNNRVTIDCTDSESRYVSEDGIIGPMFGYSSSVLQTAKTVTAFYVFDYTGCVMRSVDADITRYGRQVAISDIAKECIYGTSDSIMSLFASSQNANWKTLSYGSHIKNALNTYSLPILNYLESDTFLIKFCKFSEILSNDRIDILEPVQEGDDSYNSLAQEYELYYGSKLYPYMLKSSEGVTFNEFRNRVMEGVDVENGYFALGADFDLDGNSLGFDNINFNIIGHGNAITINTEKLFANTLNKERLITSVNFVSTKGILGTNNGLIYNSVISGHQEYEYIQGYESSFIKENNGLVVNSGIISTVSIKQLEQGAKFGLFIAKNNSSGIVNSCFATGTIYLDKDYSETGDIAGFINTVAEKSHIMNIISATSINVTNDDKLEYGTNIKAFVSTFTGDEIYAERVFVDKLSVGFKDAYDFNVLNGDKNLVKNKIYFVNTSYLVDSSDEGNATSGNDNLKVLLGAKTTTEDKEINLKYALAGRNANYDYYMAYNYGYPFPALIAYYKDSSIMRALSTGNGTEIAPYLIPHAGKVDWIRTMLVENTSKSFNISNDIYMNVYESFEPLLNSSAGKFNVKDGNFERNTFDYFANLAYVSAHSNKPFKLNGINKGTQYTIYYLTQDIETDAGLFESLQKDQNVYNLAMAYADITTTGDRAGVLAGAIKNGAIVNNIGIFNSIMTFTDEIASKFNVGGMTGYVENENSITKCSAEVQINIPATSSTVNIGGLVGYAKNVKLFDYCYSGSTINILDGTTDNINKTNIGGITGYNFNEENGGTKFESCVILTSVNYSGLVGYKYNLKNYGTEGKIEGQELQNKDQITTFANIGNIVGVSNRNNDTLVVDKIVVNSCYFNEDITMVANTCVVGNDYGNYKDNLVPSTYRSIVLRLRANGYSSIGARLGSKANSYEIDGTNNTLQDFGNTGKFVMFGELIGNVNVSSEGANINSKFIYGNNQYIIVGGNVINRAINSIISAINLSGESVGVTTFRPGETASGVLVNYSENTIIKKINSSASISSDAKYVGGILGYGSASLVMDSKVSVNITSTYARSYVGGVAGVIERGGYWFCTGTNDRVTTQGKYGIAGGIAGYVPEENAFIISCNMTSGYISASLDSGIAGGLVGRLEGFIAYGEVGVTSKINLSGYYAGGLVGEVKANATNIFLNGYKINIYINNSVYGGGLVSKLQGKGYVVKNVTVTGSITGTGTIGGIVGEVTESTIGAEGNGNVVSVTLIGTVSNIGGIAGTSIMSNISYNEFNGMITNAGKNVGGIVGTALSSKISHNTVSSEENKIKGSNNIGGIVGYVKTPLEDEEISGTTNISYNVASIEIESSGTNVGGIVGYVNQINTTVSENIHTKSIKGYDNVGGIVGASGLPVDKQNGTVASITKNHHKSGSIVSYNVAGGITGYIASSTSRENIVGEDAVINISGTTVGGVIGKVSNSIDSEGSNENVTINSDAVSNRDHIIEGTQHAGGILGYSNTSVSIVGISMYAKTISGENAGGVVGYGERARISSWSVIKFNVVTGTNVGGLYGVAKSTTMPSISIPEDIGQVKGKNVGAYAGSAYISSLMGKDKEYLKLTQKEGDSGLKLIAITSGGAVGSVFGEAERCNLKYLTTTLTLEGKSSKSMGGFIGTLKTTSIEDCISEAKFTGSAENLGGIAGMSEDGSGNPISNCIYKGEDLNHSAKNVGGIIGYAKGVSLNKNSITSDIKITASNGGTAGSIAGYVETSSVKNEVTVVVKVKEISAPEGSAGGIVGSAKNASITDFVISSLDIVSGYNAGGAVGYALTKGGSETTIANISYSTQMKIEGRYIGGLVGYADGAGSKVNVKNSTIKLDSLVGNASNGDVGGLVGHAKYVEVAGCKILSNTRVVDGKEESYGYTMSGHSVGGIFGYASNSSVTGTEVSTVNITSGDYVGGIVGYAESMSNIDAPKVLKLNTNGVNSGGVAGYIQGNAGQISGIKLYGTINGNGNTGGVAGYAKDSKITGVDLTNVTVNCNGGESGGMICGTAEDCEITDMTVKNESTIKNAKYGSAGVGKLIGGSMNVKVASTFKFNATAANGGSYGAFAGYSTGAITANVVGGSALRITMGVSNNAKFVGGFVGENRGGGSFSCSVGAVGVNVNAKTSEYVGGMFGHNSGSVIGGYSFYYQIACDKQAGGFYAEGTADLPSGIKFFIHKYTSGANSTNTALSYANARVNGGSASNYSGGDVWGVTGGKYSIYPNENFNYRNLPSQIFVLSEDCRTLSNPSMSNVANAVKSAPAYVKDNDNEVYLQCSVSTTPTVTYFYDNWRYNFVCTNDGQLMSSIELAAETYYKNASKNVNKRELFADMMTCDIKWAAYNNFQGSTMDFNRDYSGISYSDIAYSLNEAYGYDIKNKTYSSWSELKADIKSEAKGYTFSIDDETLMKKWTVFWRNCHANWGDKQIFKSEAELKRILENGSSYHSGSGTDQESHNQFINFLKSQTKAFGDSSHSLVTESTFGNPSTGGVVCWYPNQESYFNSIRTLEEMYNAANIKFTDSETHKVVIDTIKFTARGKIDDNKNKEFDMETQFDVCCNYTYGVGVAPLSGAPGVFKYSGSSGEYPLFKQGGRVWSSDRMSPGSGTIGSVGCLITSITCCIASTGLAPNINPGILNEWIVRNHGYVNGSNFVWNSTDNARWSGNYRGQAYNYDLTGWRMVNHNVRYNPSRVQDLFNQGYKIVIEVYHADQDGQHWLAITNVSNGGNLVSLMDPAYGDYIELPTSRRYGGRLPYKYTYFDWPGRV